MGYLKVQRQLNCRGKEAGQCSTEKRQHLSTLFVNREYRVVSGIQVKIVHQVPVVSTP